MSTQELLALAKMVEETSEILWQMALIRVHAEAFQDGIWAIIFFVGMLGTLLGCLRAFHTAKKQDCSSSKESWEIFGIVLVIASAICLIAFGGFTSAGVGRLIAPEFFAIRFLLGLTL